MENPAGDLLIVRVAIAGDRKAAERGVELLRDEVVPGAFDGSGAQAYVTGITAMSMDFTDAMYRSVPYVFGFVLGLSFLLLLVMFRSIVIPVKAILLNLLSVASAFGVLVMVFQWGWGGQPAGLRGPGRDRTVDADNPLRHRFRPLHGLPHAAAESDQGSL